MNISLSLPLDADGLFEINALHKVFCISTAFLDGELIPESSLLNNGGGAKMRVIRLPYMINTKKITD